MLRPCVIAPPAQLLCSGGQTDSEVRTSQTWHWLSPTPSPLHPTPSFPKQIQAGRTQQISRTAKRSAVIERSVIIKRLWMNVTGKNFNDLLLLSLLCQNKLDFFFWVTFLLAWFPSSFETSHIHVPSTCAAFISDFTVISFFDWSYNIKKKKKNLPLVLNVAFFV